MLDRGERKIKTSRGGNFVPSFDPFVLDVFLDGGQTDRDGKREREEGRKKKKIFNKRENSRVMSLGDVFDLERT